MADGGFNKDGGAQRPVEQQLPPPVPRPKQAPTKPVSVPKFSNPHGPRGAK
jgi:hypothetical protein